MTERKDKVTILAEMQKGYSSFGVLLASLSESQMTVSGVNSSWSVKDNIAHLSAWHLRLLAMLRAVHEGGDRPGPVEDLSMDQMNERFYQANKARSLADVRAQFRATYEELVEQVRAMSDEDLNRPIAWLNGRSVWPYIAGDTYEHYQEHAAMIRDWLLSTMQQQV